MVESQYKKQKEILVKSKEEMMEIKEIQWQLNLLSLVIGYGLVISYLVIFIYQLRLLNWMKLYLILFSLFFL